MAWFVVPPLEALRAELNRRCPNRDKTSDGSIGDYQHQQGRSSHNPDDTGLDNAEWDSDADNLQEVRARDFDVDLNDDITMEQVVQYLVRGARAGRFWWLRYIIYRSRIWHRNTGWETREYTGVNTHTLHAHVNSQFTQTADGYTGAVYGLEDLGMPTADEIAAAVIGRLDTAPIGDGRTLGGTLRALADTIYDERARDDAHAKATAAGFAADTVRDQTVVAQLQALPRLLVEELADAGGTDAVVVEAAVERALSRLQITVTGT